MTTDGSRGTIHRLLRATEELQAIPPSDSPLGFLLISRVLSVLFWLGPRWKTIFFAIVGAAPRFQVPSRAVDVGRQTESKFQLVVQQTRQNPLSASQTPTCQHPPKSVDIIALRRAPRACRSFSLSPPEPKYFDECTQSHADSARPTTLSSRTGPVLQTVAGPSHASAPKHPTTARSSHHAPPPPTTHPLRPPPCRQNSGAGSSSITSQMAETAGGSA